MNKQERIEAMRQGDPPLPLTPGQALAQAYRLRMKHGLPYTTLARVIGEYHGVWMSEGHWRKACRDRGAPIVRDQLPPHLRKKVAA